MGIAMAKKTDNNKGIGKYHKFFYEGIFSGLSHNRMIISSAVFLCSIFYSFAHGQDFAPGGMTSMKIATYESRSREPAGVDVAVWPTALADAENTHYLTRTMPTIMIFAIANPDAVEPQHAWLVFDLPPDISLLGVNNLLTWSQLQTSQVTHDGQTYTRYQIPCSVHETTFPRGFYNNSWYNRYRPPAIWLTSSLQPGPTGKIYYHVIYEADEVQTSSPEQSVDVTILPAINATQPAIAGSGVMGRFILNTNETATAGIITEYIKDLGYNFYIAGPSQSYAPSGLERWSNSRIQNGFRLDGVSQGDIPTAIRYVSNNGNFPNAVSPWSIYREHSFITDNLFDLHQQEVTAGEATSTYANWEAYAYLQNGDYSQQSMEEFITWSGLTRTQVETGWPLQTIATYPLEWKQFRNWELGMATQAMTEKMTEMGGNSRFCVAVSSTTIGPGAITLGGYDMAIIPWGDMPYDLQTWQYCFVPNLMGAYPVSDRCGAVQVVRSGALSRILDQAFGVNRQVRFSCAYGYEQTSMDGYFLPEQLGFLHLSTIFAGAEFAANYPEYPVWDGRYAREIALANTRIALWEDMILNGSRTREHVLIPISPYPQQVAGNVTPSEQEVDENWTSPEPPEYLYSFEYHKDGKRLITIANTWDYADVFVRIKFPDMTSGSYMMREPEENRVFANASGNASLSSSDLANGLLVHIGATRWGAFLLESYDAQIAGAATLITQAAIEAIVSDRTDTWDDDFQKKLETLPTVAYLSFDNGIQSGTDGIWDFSGYWNHGTANGNLAIEENGLVQQGANFNGGYISIPYESSLNFDASDFSVSAWIWPAVHSTTQGIVGTGNPYNSNGKGWILSYYNNDYLHFQINNGTGLGVAVSAYAGNLTDKWHHVAVTADRDGNAVIYLDGQLLISGNISPKSGGTFGSSPVYAGKYGAYSGGYFNGVMDEVSIFNQVIGGDDIEYLFNRHKTVCVLGHWAFETMQGGTGGVPDSSVLAGHGTISGNVVSDAQGKTGNCANFGGGYISIPYSRSLDFGGYADFSISAWIKPSVHGTTQGIVGTGNPYNSNGVGWILSYYNNDYMHFQINNGTGLMVAVAAYAGDLTGGWHHVAVSIDRDSNAVIYLDGRFLASKNVSAEFGGTLGSNPVYIGRFGSYSGAYFSGRVDEVRIFGQALNNAEIFSLYND